MTECVGETGIEEVGELGAFFIGETGVVSIGLRVLDVYLLMCHVHVATNKHGFLCIKFLKVETECVIPCHALVKAF